MTAAPTSGQATADEAWWERWDEATRRRVLIIMSSSIFLVPVSTTIYLPSMVAIQNDLSATATEMAITLSLYTLAAGLMPLVYGPLSDRWGRRRILLVALLIYVGTSLWCALADDVWTLAIGRGLQAIGVSSCFVVSAAAVADVYPPERRGRAFGLLGVAPVLGPILGPLLGGVVADLFGWRAIFIALAVAGAIILVPALLLLPETLKPPTDVPPFRPWAPLLLLRDPGVAMLVAVGAGVFMAMYHYVTLAPFLGTRVHGLTELGLGFLFVPFGVGALFGTVIGGRMTDRLGTWPTVRVGVLGTLATMVAVYWMLETEGWLYPLYGMLLGAGFFSFFLRPAVGAAAIARVPAHAGAVSGLSASMMLIGGAFVSPVSTELEARTSALVAGLPFILFIALCLFIMWRSRHLFAGPTPTRGASGAVLDGDPPAVGLSVGSDSDA